MVDFGYDIADFYNVDPTYGTMADLENLFAEAAKLNIKIVLDFVPNHSSDQCEWFLKSVQRDPVYENYYIWHDGIIDQTTGLRRPPNNWVCIKHEYVSLNYIVYIAYVSKYRIQYSTDPPGLLILCETSFTSISLPSNNLT